VRARWLITMLVLGFLSAACASGPSPEAVAAGNVPSSTTTTEAPPEGVVVISITNGSFRPSNLKVDLNNAWLVEWRHEDAAQREYVITARNGEFESPLLKPGDVFQVDFSKMKPGIYRYFAILGNTRVPGSIDTRPRQ